jgi:hypothetical protein
MVKNRSRAERQQEKHFQQMAAGGGAVVQVEPVHL